MHINILSNFIAYQLLHPSNSLVFSTLLYVFLSNCDEWNLHF